MKLSDKAKKNFVEDNEFYIHIGKKIKQARLDREIYVQNFDEKLEVDGYYNDTVQITPENSEQQTHFDLNEII